MHNDAIRRLSKRYPPLILSIVVVGLCLDGLWGCSGQDAKDADTASCEAAECRPDEGGGDPASDGDGAPGAAAGCHRCEDYEVCLDGKCLCEPSCDGKSIKDDGCGGLCACPEGTVANEHLRCVAPAECSGSCDVAGWECGEICGASCGECGPGHGCESGHCACEPTCDGTRCDDGCGGACPCADGTVCNLSNECVPPEACEDTCETAKYACGVVCGEPCGACGAAESCVNHQCAAALNCESCSLKLSLVDKTIQDNSKTVITLAVDYEPGEGEPKPRMFDIRLKANGAASLTGVAVGEALHSADKDLYTDPDTLDKWQERADGTYRFVAFSVTDNREIEKGRLMTLRFSADTDSVPLFSIVKKAQTFAPPLADEALQSSDYEETIRVTQ